MKKKIKEYGSCRMRKTIQKNGLLRCELFEGHFSDVSLAKFYVPVQEDHPFMVSEDIVRYRLLHDFGITVGHMTVTLDKEL